MSVLPGVRSSSGEFAKTARIGSLPAGIPICAMAGDQQSALFGQTCFRPGQMKNTYGTGCFMLMNAGRKRPTSRHGLITTLACGHKGEAVYALEGAVFIGGAAIQWLRDGLKIIKSAPESEGMSTAIKDNEGVYFVPALVGLGAPYWDQDARGAFFGITRGTTPNHFVRAAVEAMCYQTKDVIVSMEKDSGLKVRDLRIDGGAVKNDFLCRFQADILGIDVLRPRTVEITSLGAAYLAGLSCGFWKSSGEIEKLWKTDRRFTPRMTRKNAGRYYDGWKDAVRRTLSEPSGGMSGAI
jgi:glycerol kinase